MSPPSGSCLQLSAVLLFAMGVYGVTIDIEKRQIDRGVREATLFSLIARTHALPDGKGSRAVKSGVEALARDGVAMKEINLSGADLRGAKLTGAIFQTGRSEQRDPRRSRPQRRRSPGSESQRRGIQSCQSRQRGPLRCQPHRSRPHGGDPSRRDPGGSQSEGHRAHRCRLLERAQLRRCGYNLSANGAYSNFAGADLSDASFTDTELQGAVFDGADLGGTRLNRSYDLSDSQIEKACTSSDTPPVLPKHLEWTGRRC